MAPQQDASFPPCGGHYVLSASVGPAAVDEGAAPLDFALGQSAPNPTHGGRTRIRYTVRRPTSVRLAIYGVRGELVRTLVAGVQAAGPQSIVWDGRNDAGTPVESGVYFCRLAAGTLAASRTLVLVK